MAYYPFNGNANDVSGNNNNPSFNNATLTTDRLGNPNSAYRFNGTSNYMQIPNSPSINPPNQISISAWIKPMGFYQGPCHGNSIVMKGDADYLTGNYLLRFDDGSFTNFQNCVNPVPDVTHENFYGANIIAPGGYTPFIQTGQWYSVAYTYDGTTAKLYVNCLLKFSGPVNGLAFNNQYDLFFGKMNHPQYPYWLNGDLDDIRIYNRPLNQDEVAALGGCANPISNIINNYTPVLALSPCDNKITLEDATAFNAGDTVLMIQMKGAIIDSNNTAAFGTITDYKNAGNYDFNFVKSKSGNIIELKNFLTRQYDIPAGRVQLIRVPYYPNATVSSTLTCLPWDGTKGGVLVLNVQDSVVLNANIDVSGKGFRGGSDPFSNPASFNCYENQFYYPVNPDLASGKGEGIAEVSASKSFGKGALANGGGGGNSHNSGGGGGGNGATGGFGGYNFEGAPCDGTVPFDNRGIGGKLLTYSNAANKIFLGGGGGAGHSNNPEAFQSTGGNGSGIVIINAGKFLSNGNKIIAKGNNGAACSGTGSGCHEGMGGGGAGGTVVLRISNYLDPSLIEIMGGNGANMTASGFLKVGPGGGGGGGKVWLMNPSLPAPVSVTVTGGANGVCTGYANDPWGATQGQLGSLLFNHVMPLDIIPFKPNIDSVRIKDSSTGCSSFDFKGFGYTNMNPINSWQWFFGDAATANTQNTSHTYATAGNYTVKLVVTDINGCKDSISKNVTTSLLLLDAGPADTICAPASTVLQANTTGGIQFSWTPAAYLNDPTLLNPTATPPITTTFYLTATNAQGCSLTDSVIVNVRSVNAFSINPPVSVCKNNTVQLNATGGDLYNWQPAASLNNPAISNPNASPQTTTTYSVLITDTLCNNTSTLSTVVTVLPLPTIQAGKSNDIDCSNDQSQLIATGAVKYSWSPSTTLNNPAIVNPIAKPIITTQYVVKGTDQAGCINYDSITVNVVATNKGGYLMPSGFTPNNDGLNDCYGIKYWGIIQELDFSIYNRWGERIFRTKQPGQCWDGKYKGIQQDPGVFVYMIKAKTSCEASVFRKGTFVLIR